MLQPVFLIELSFESLTGRYILHIIANYVFFFFILLMELEDLNVFVMNSPSV